MSKFDPMNEPEYCPICDARPEWEEVWEGGFQCLNCLSVISSDGTIAEERREHEEGDDEE